jgi:symplekin
MGTVGGTIDEQVHQLDEARKLVLSDATYYPHIIQGVLPLIGRDARVEFRRWGADFLAETFASPSLPTQQKESLSLVVLETLKAMIENPQEDPAVVKSIVQTAASIYPLVVRWMYVSPCLPLTHFHDDASLLQNSCHYGLRFGDAVRVIDSLDPF